MNHSIRKDPHRGDSSDANAHPGALDAANTHGSSSSISPSSGNLPRRFGQVGGLWDEPIYWAIPILHAGRTHLRVHFFFILFILIQVGHAIWPRTGYPAGGDWSFTLIGLGALAVVLLIHEAAHWLVNHLLGGASDEIILWPLGGLSPHETPGGWKPNLLTALAGPIANLTLCLLLTPILTTIIVVHWEYVLFNPLDPATPYSLWVVDGKPPWWALGLWWMNYASLSLLIFNLIPMYPLDGATIAETIIGSRTGERRAAEFTTVVGYGGAVFLTVIALIASNNLLLGVAIFGAIMSWLKRRQIAFITQPISPAEELRTGTTPIAPLLPRNDEGDWIEFNADDSTGATPQPAGLDDTAIIESELDRILQKIHDQGMDQLTPDERDILDAASERRRRRSSRHLE